MNTAEYLTQLIDCKEDMKAVIEERGITITGGLSTYADLIRSLKQNPNYIKFFGSTELITIPEFNTWNYNDMSHMFEGCSSLTSIPQLDTSNVTNMNSMFSGCYSITEIPLLDTSKVTNMNLMFNGCRNLTSIPQLDTSSVTSMRYMFSFCDKLTEIPLLDASNVTDIIRMFEGCKNSLLINGLVNLGKKDIGSTSDAFKYIYNMQSIENIINNLYDRKAANKSKITLIFELVNLIPQKYIDIAENKGWIIK